MKPPRAKPYPNETALSVACMARIREEYDGWVFKVKGGPSQMKGVSDLVGVIGGRFCSVELKQPGKKPTPLQYKRLRDVEAAGGLAGWVRTEVELDELLSHLLDPLWRNPQLVQPGVPASA